MIRIFATTCASLLASCIPAVYGGMPANELLTNGDFEEFREGWAYPVNWRLFRGPEDVSYTVDREVAFSGLVSLRLESPDIESRAGWSRGSVGGPGIQSGAVVLFAGHYRTLNVEAGQRLGICARLTFVDTDRQVQATHYAKGGDGTAEWRRTETLLNLPENISTVHPVLFLYGSGTAWWDAVSLRWYLPQEAIELLAPLPNACVPEARPQFSWTPVPEAEAYTFEISSSPVFDLDCTERLENLLEPRAHVREPLTPATIYHWRVRARMADGSERISLLEHSDGYAFHTFYAGTWKQRSKDALDKLARYRDLHTQLVRFAEMNRMWEPFPRLKAGIERLERIVAENTSEAREALSTLSADFADLEMFVSWWETMFLNDEAFLDTLDFSQPGLDKARAAWDRRDVPGTLAELLAYFKARQQPVCFFDTVNRPPPPPEGAQPRVIPGADLLLQHLYPIPENLYGEKVFDLGPGFNWHINPIVDREWPTRIHRHLQWRDICDAYWATYNEKYAEEWRQQLLDWAKDNPIERWNPRTMRMSWSTLNAAARMIERWPAALLQIRGAEVFDETTLLVFLKGVQQHGRFLMQNQARGGNWVIHEAKAQLMMGMFFPEFKEAAEWFERGLSRTRQELDSQVFDDGVHIERTAGYHGGCLESFVSVLQLLALNKIDFDGRTHFLNKIEKMYDFYLYGIKPDGTMPVLGNTGRTRYRPFLETGYKRFRRLDFLSVASAGEKGVEPVRTSHAFPTAGLYAMRSDWNDENALFMFLDAGGFYGHCHLDNLTFELHAYGRTLIAEAGRYCYNPELNQYFRGTIGHNTILIDRQNMEREPPPECQVWTPTPQFDYLNVLHRAYPGITHQRRVLFVKPAGQGADGYWIVVDDVTGDGVHRCDQRFHFEPDLKAEIKGLQTWSTDPEGANLLIAAPEGQAGVSLALEDGWVSYLWYGKRPAQVAQFTQEGPLPVHFDTVLYPQRPGDRASLEVTRIPVEGAVVLRIDGKAAGATFSDLAILREEDATGPIEAAGCRTDARVAVVRRELDGTPVRALIEHGTFLECDTKPLLRTAQTVDFAAVRWDGQAITIDAAAATTLEVLRLADSATVSVNDKPLAADHIGTGTSIILKDVEPAQERPIPREPGEPNIAYEPPSTQEVASSLLAQRRAPDVPMPIFIEAETYAAEGGGGQLQIDSRKVNASRDAIIRWDKGGHWVEWIFTVHVEGDYALAVRVATAHTRVLRRIELDGQVPDERLEAVEFDYTGGWATHHDDWAVFDIAEAPGKPAPIRLTAGEHTLRMTNLKGSLNVDWLLFTPLVQTRSPAGAGAGSE